MQSEFIFVQECVPTMTPGYAGCIPTRRTRDRQTDRDGWSHKIFCHFEREEHVVMKTVTKMELGLFQSDIL
jgi:hypothetical protein